MKSIRISDGAHRELTRLLGEMMAETGKPHTYNDVVNTFVAQSVILPRELIEKIDTAINANKGLGYKTREKFVEDAITEMLQKLSGNHEKPRSAKASKPKD